MHIYLQAHNREKEPLPTCVCCIYVCLGTTGKYKCPAMGRQGRYPGYVVAFIYIGMHQPKYPRVGGRARYLSRVYGGYGREWRVKKDGGGEVCLRWL